MIAVTMGRVLFLICYLSDLMKGTELGNRVLFFDGESERVSKI